MAFTDLRQFLAVLENSRELIRIKERINSRFEMTAVLRQLDRMDGPALDPSAGDTFIHTKMGMDATKPPDDLERFERVSVPEECRRKAKEILKNYL